MKSYPVQVLFREYFEGILAALFLAMFLRFFVLSVLYVPTQNMNPNLQSGDFVIGWRLAYGFPLPLMKGERLNFKPPTRGDMISFRFPGDDEQIIIRRVIGIAGDEIETKGGRLFINGVKVDLSSPEQEIGLEALPAAKKAHRILNHSTEEMNLVTVPKGHIFVLSDNRKKTDDSRDWGFVPYSKIESRLGFIWLSMESKAEGLEIFWPRVFTWVE